MLGGEAAMSYNIEAALFLVSQKIVFGGIAFDASGDLNLAIGGVADGDRLFRPDVPITGWLWRWQRQGQPERVRIEDALKYLYRLQRVGTSWVDRQRGRGIGDQSRTRRHSWLAAGAARAGRGR